MSSAWGIRESEQKLGIHSLHKPVELLPGSDKRSNLIAARVLDLAVNHAFNGGIPKFRETKELAIKAAYASAQAVAIVLGEMGVINDAFDATEFAERIILLYEKRFNPENLSEDFRQAVTDSGSMILHNMNEEEWRD